jgi:hypothetical protein
MKQVVKGFNSNVGAGQPDDLVLNGRLAAHVPHNQEAADVFRCVRAGADQVCSCPIHVPFDLFKVVASQRLLWTLQLNDPEGASDFIAENVHSLVFLGGVLRLDAILPEELRVRATGQNPLPAADENLYAAGTPGGSS